MTFCFANYSNFGANPMNWYNTRSEYEIMLNNLLNWKSGQWVYLFTLFTNTKDIKSNTSTTNIQEVNTSQKHTKAATARRPRWKRVRSHVGVILSPLINQSYQSHKYLCDILWCLSWCLNESSLPEFLKRVLIISKISTRESHLPLADLLQLKPHALLPGRSCCPLAW